MSRNWYVVLGAAALLVLGGVLAAVAVAWHGSGGGSPVATSRVGTIGISRPASPPPGAVVLAAESGSRALALAVGKGKLTATVIAPSGSPEPGLKVSFRAGGKTLDAHPCGAGCYTASAPRAPLVEVQTGAGPPVVFRIPAHAQPAEAIVRRAGRVFRGLHSLVYTESLHSTPKLGLQTTWKMQAPDRFSFQIKGGASAISIGDRRWDRSKPGGAWSAPEQTTPSRVPQPTWGNLAANAHVLGKTRIAGRPVWIVSFVNPSVPAWFTAWIDRDSYRTLQMRMTAASHFMFHRYLEFNEPLGISPPR